MMQKRAAEGTISLPVPLHKIVRRGTLLAIIRQSGLGKVLFENEP
jgi:hypothetical protein